MSHATIQTSRENGLEYLDPDDYSINSHTVAHARASLSVMTESEATSLNE